MKPPLTAKICNDFQTPPQVLNPLYKFLNPNWVIWECAAGEGNLVKALTFNNYKVIGTDIITGDDFLFTDERNLGINFDCIITNPPYSLKQQFLERAYSLGKPFAFLLPLTTFETPKRQELFKRFGIEMIMFDKRIHFKTPNKPLSESKSWFATAWFTWGLNIGRQLTFEKFEQA